MNRRQRKKEASKRHKTPNKNSRKWVLNISGKICEFSPNKWDYKSPDDFVKTFCGISRLKLSESDYIVITSPSGKKYFYDGAHLREEYKRYNPLYKQTEKLKSDFNALKKRIHQIIILVDDSINVGENAEKATTEVSKVICLSFRRFWYFYTPIIMITVFLVTQDSSFLNFGEILKILFLTFHIFTSQMPELFLFKFAIAFLIFGFASYIVPSALILLYLRYKLVFILKTKGELENGNRVLKGHKELYDDIKTTEDMETHSDFLAEETSKTQQIIENLEKISTNHLSDCSIVPKTLKFINIMFSIASIIATIGFILFIIFFIWGTLDLFVFTTP